MTNEEVGRVFETMLSIPGMNENVKIDLKVSRKQVLLLALTIEKGLNGEEDGFINLMRSASKETANEISSIAEDCLQKAGLTDLVAKLKALKAK